MTQLREEDIHFVEKSRCKTEGLKTDYNLLKKTIYDVKLIIDDLLTEKYYSNKKLKIQIKEHDFDFSFSIDYPNNDIFPDESVQNIIIQIWEKIDQYFDNIKIAFYLKIDSSWEGSYLFYNLCARPYFDFFRCPVCNCEIEYNTKYLDMFVNNEPILMCDKHRSHRTFFVEDLINNYFLSSECYEITDKLHIQKIIPNFRIHALVAFQLNRIAIEEGNGFLSLDCDTNNPAMYLITEDNIPAGYIFWNDYDFYERCIRQLFIREKFRRNNFATILTKKTIEIESNSQHFNIESPNDTTKQILLNLGFAKINGDQFEYIGCSRV